MKTLLCLFIFSAFLFSCGNNAEREATTTSTNETASQADKTGSFSFDGKTVNGKVETQYHGDRERGNFSVLCQHNESSDISNSNFELLQVTFINEKDANTNPHLKIYDSGSSLPMTEPEPGIVAVSLSGVGSDLDNKEFTGTEKSTGSILVKNRIVEIKDLILFNADGEKRTVNATLPF